MCVPSCVASSVHHLTIRDQPRASVTAGSTTELALNVTLLDEYENVCTLDSSSDVQLSLAPGFNVGGATLSGTTHVTAVAGVASFVAGSLSLDKAGAGYRLQASVVAGGGGTATVNTDAFAVLGTCCSMRVCVY